MRAQHLLESSTDSTRNYLIKLKHPSLARRVLGVRLVTPFWCGDPAHLTGEELRSMKLITAIIKPHKLEDVRKAVGDVGVQGITVTDVRGYGRQRGHTEIYRGAEYNVEFVPKTKIEIAVTDSLVDQVIEAITQAGKTGKVGDGKIFVLDLEQVVRIRTGERDASAI
jgi:nitrogen regulatory protein P-II 2